MIQTINGQFRIGEWQVDPARNLLQRGREEARIDPRTMRLLLCLAERPGEIVSIDQLLDTVWADVTVAPDSVYQAVTQLRRQFGDDPKAPTYIATAPRQGYRLLAAVDRPHASIRSDRRRARVAFAAVAFLVLAGLSTAFLWRAYRSPAPDPLAHASARPTASIAVLPFLDLTDAMDHEQFVDGMTEELVDLLSRQPGLQVAPPRSTFSFKGTRATPVAVARALDVGYVLDGSVRRSGTEVHVTARLVQADNGFIIWSQSYDRSAGDFLGVQRDIASAVERRLAAESRADNKR
ncbi:winged helix-turn-helix domain-containing protein [Sphingobium sp. BYY-5]|uniref:winged helix-turn-helix domain-containing protein n=1 Tax=Sphingobium sp. BYY-5 TaxID=2926400 RepID=UPI001FA6F49B|nr:winged helix-turn-helix domain-containing protein [Sphingobium sp. BYY-5]MCI4591234.1 winged helix-turn-helix domain-containing protein [Sphingobium sp. BYY-5]